MFGLEWSKKSKNTVVDYGKYSDEITKNISHISPLMWGEHCLECAVPECYGFCKKFEPRRDGRCKRFANGIEKVPGSKGSLGYGVKVSFTEWAKLESVLLPSKIPYKKLLGMDRLFRAITAVSKALPTHYPGRMVYLFREYTARRTGLKGNNFADLFLAEFINPGKPYTLILETKTDTETMFRKSLVVNPGFNRFIIPFSELRYVPGTKNSISLYPENDAVQEVYICSLDLVSLSKPVSECINLPKIKCVVWDLDNTMWRGILSENDELVLNEKAVNAVKELDRRGILNSIASKNDYAETYAQLEKFGIAEYFLCPQISWGLKSSAVKKIAQILDIGIDTFAFVDDTPAERAEVSGAIPLIRTFDALDIDGLMSSPHVDVPVTEASATRRQSYVEIAKRNSDMAEFEGDLPGFVKSCDLKVTLAKPPAEDYDRCHELIQRTNQLNLSGERLTAEEMAELFEDKNILSQEIRVTDKYGNYGLVGVAIYSIRGDTATLNHFVLSCRAARKLVEQAYFEFMIKYFADKGIKTFTAKCAITAKNALLRSSIEAVCGTETTPVDETHYLVSVPCEGYNPEFDGLMTIEFK